MNLEQLTEAVWQRLQDQKPRALLIGSPPDDCHNFNYVNEKPYEAVVLGVLSPGELLQMPTDPVCRALLAGLPVYLSGEQMHHGDGPGRMLRKELRAAEQHLQQLGVRRMGQERQLITAETARRMRQEGHLPEPGSRLTPLAREILEGKET